MEMSALIPLVPLIGGAVALLFLWIWNSRQREKRRSVFQSSMASLT